MEMGQQGKNKMTGSDARREEMGFCHLLHVRKAERIAQQTCNAGPYKDDGLRVFKRFKRVWEEDWKWRLAVLVMFPASVVVLRQVPGFMLPRPCRSCHLGPCYPGTH